MRVLYVVLIVAALGVLVYLSSMDTRPKATTKATPGPANILQEGDVTLNGLKGKVVLLDFWATWCPPCRAALPHTQALADSADAKAGNLEVLAVNMQEPEAEVRKFIEAEGYSFKVLMDPKSSISGQFSFSGIPTFVILDRAGKKVFQQTGVDEAALDAALQKALAAK